MPDLFERATFGAGCFWCVEAIFKDLKGVQKVISGYMGGSLPNPTYQQICTGTTGHAEVIQVQFDPNEISFAELLYVFWRSHDPTTLNQQGADQGTQYRSAIFYHNETQKELAEKSKQETDQSDLWKNPIVTEISAAPEFYPAEEYHQNYFQINPNQPYCMAIIDPKVKKFKKEFSDKLKETS